jgi:glycosyltransferase involved in cell wall biosynthesis
MLKILCLTSHDLDAPAHGAIVRARNVFKLLARLGDVHVVLAGFYKQWNEPLPMTCRGFELIRSIYFEQTLRPPLRDRIRHELDPRFMNTEWMQASASDRAWLQSTLPAYDLVWIHGLGLANGFNLWHWPASVLDVDDIQSSVQLSRAAQASGAREKMRYRWMAARWRRHEKKLPERFTAVCVCSDPDVPKLGWPKNTFVVPNGFEPPAAPLIRQPATPPRIGFIGNFGHLPNREGMEWFLERVWPLIVKKHPPACLRIAGGGKTAPGWPRPNVEVLGWVADTEAEMATWSLAIVPILTGGGTRVKIAEYMSRHCPIVSTALGAYGYDLADGRDFLQGDQPGTFAARCLQILEDPALGEKLAENNWQQFITAWTWDAQADRISRVVQFALAESRRSPKVYA